MRLRSLYYRSLVLLSVLIIAFAVTTPAFAMNKSNSKTEHMALLLSTINNPYFVTMKQAAQKEAKKLGVKLQVLDAHNDSNTQVSQIQTLLGKNVDLLIVNPTNANTITPAIKQANKANVPVIFIDRSTKGGKAIAFFASDNVEAGRTACRYIAKHMNGKGSLAILTGVPGASATNERSAGCNQVLKKNPKINVVARQTAKFDRSKALNVMQNMLTSHPQGIDAVFAENDEMALGAINALKAQHALKNTMLVSIDGTPAGQKAVKKGEISLDVGQQPALMSKFAVASGYHYLENGQLFVPVPLQQYKHH